MSNTKGLQKFVSGKHLLKSLTDNPDLHALVPRLQPQRLKQLIDEVGLNDAGALIECTTPEQLNSMIDEAVWKLDVPGTPDRFDRDEFREWIAALLEIGDEFAVTRITEMDQDLIVAAMMGFVHVVDLDKKVLDTSSYVPERFTLMDVSVDNKELYGPFEVKPRREHEWETLQPMLAALHIVDPDYLQSVLTRCCLPESIVAARDYRVAMLDAADEHRQRREKSGFVTSESAAGFLSTARKSDYASLVSATEYDLDTRDYFRRATQAALDEVSKDTKPDIARLQHKGTESDADEPKPAEPDPSNTADFEETIARFELNTLVAPTPLLTGPTRRKKDEKENKLQRALASLSVDDPASLEQRLNEAAYLSNVVMTGTLTAGDRPTHEESVAAVMSIANLGYESYPEFDLGGEPGLVGLFRIGWHLLQRLPAQVAHRIRQTLTSDMVIERLGRRSWMADEIVEAMGEEEFQVAVESGAFQSVGDVLHLFSLVFDEQSVTHIAGLLDNIPVTFDAAGSPGSRRFIASATDLDVVRNLLDELPDRLKVEQHGPS